MKKYVFSYISFFDNVLTSQVITCEDLDALTVAAAALQGKGWDLRDEGISDLEELKNFAFDCECIFEIIEI